MQRKLYIICPERICSMLMQFLEHITTRNIGRTLFKFQIAYLVSGRELYTCVTDLHVYCGEALTVVMDNILIDKIKRGRW